MSFSQSLPSGYTDIAALLWDGPAECQVGLWRLLEHQTRRYTMEESTSIPVETARELLDSICFTIGVAMARRGGGIPQGNLEELFLEGQREIWARAELCRPMLDKVRESAPPFANYAYRDTVHELEGFFRAYDFRFFAHQVPCMITYPLARPVEDAYQGIAYIAEYLNRLHMENSFVQSFLPQRAARLLRRHCPQIEELPINLYDPVFVSALALAATGREAAGLSVDDACRQEVWNRFHPWREEEAAVFLGRGARRLSAQVESRDADIPGYLLSCAENLLPRLRAADTDAYRQMFPALDGPAGG